MPGTWQFSLRTLFSLVAVAACAALLLRWAVFGSDVAAFLLCQGFCVGAITTSLFGLWGRTRGNAQLSCMGGCAIGFAAFGASQDGMRAIDTLPLTATLGALLGLFACPVYVPLVCGVRELHPPSFAFVVCLVVGIAITPVCVEYATAGMARAEIYEAIHRDSVAAGWSALGWCISLLVALGVAGFSTRWSKRPSLEDSQPSVQGDESDGPSNARRATG